MSLECVCTPRRLCTQLYIVQYACMVTVYVVKLFIPQQRRRRAEQWGDLKKQRIVNNVFTQNIIQNSYIAYA